MPRYAALLRGVMPTNAKMADLKGAFESAGFTDVRTVLSSGNVAFTARAAAVARRLGQAFLCFVRSMDALRDLLAADPYRAFRVDPKAKRIVTFLRAKPSSPPELPIERDGARILVMKRWEVVGASLRTPKGPVFMTLIEKTFGKDVTTRTWDTVAKVARA